MKPEELTQTLAKMRKDTQEGKLHWKLEVQTTEGNEEKYTVEEDGVAWIVDECYTSFLCEYQGREFCMITYEMIKASPEETKTVNYVFLPPLGVRLFSLHTLLPHSVEANAVVISHVHALWELLVELWKNNSEQVSFRVTEASVNIEED
ncbi:MAG: hypothetical protein NC307_07625 [Roseburia sp.]|nr:hypothetical protein [Roseburia sp.]